MSKLISEPPLLVLPSLAREVGLTDAIVLQQLHYAGQRTVDGWIERSAADWSRALRGVIAARSLERIFPKLLELEWVEARPTPGKPTAYRVAPRKLAEVVPADSVGSPPADSGGSLSREENTEKGPSSKTPPKRAAKKKILPLEEEPEGFLDWLGHHVTFAATVNLSQSVPRHGTSYRSSLARTFADLVNEGYSLEEFELASEGVLSDEYMRTGGWVKPENVLRKEKIGGRIQDGRSSRARRDEGGGKYGHLDE